ncbi:MAG: MerR family transcriptional regulator [Acidobacteriota bacterium]
MSSDASELLSIGQVAQASGLASSAIRYYERCGLIPSPARVGGKRRFETDVLFRLEMIQIGQEAGFSLEEVKTLLVGIGGGRRGPRALTKLAQEKLPEVRAGLERLKLLERVLKAAAECECPDLETCAQAMRRAGLVRSPRLGRKGLRRPGRRLG